MNQWPATLQDFLNEDGFKYLIGKTTIRSKMGVGPEKVRRLFTKGVDKINCSITVNKEQWSIIYTFFDVTLNGGTDTFEFNHPITDALIEIRMEDTPQATPIGGAYFRVDMLWEVMP